jgi:hypothetical protein
MGAIYRYRDSISKISVPISVCGGVCMGGVCLIYDEFNFSNSWRKIIAKNIEYKIQYLIENSIFEIPIGK